MISKETAHKLHILGYTCMGLGIALAAITNKPEWALLPLGGLVIPVCQAFTKDE